MVDNHLQYGARNHENIKDNFIQYGLPYKTHGNDSNFDYYRSSSSSSSSGSGKVLVHRPYNVPYATTSRFNPIYKEELTSKNISLLTSQTDQITTGKFYNGSYMRPASPQLSGSGFYVPEPNTSDLLTVPPFPGLEGIPGQLSRNFVYDNQDINSTNSGKIGPVTESFWQIPRANLWCNHKDFITEGSKCSDCEFKDETTSNCSSVNPPPTFTALDNIHPVKRRKRWCKCAITCLTTTAFCFLVLSIIAGYILYVEVVLKRNQYVPEPM